MAIAPGKIYVGTTMRLTTAFVDDDGEYIDPDNVLFRTRSPCGVEATYTYGEDAEVGQSSTGNYYADFRVTEPGRWFFRWETYDDAGAPYFNEEGTLIVQDSVFYTGNTDYL